MGWGRASREISRAVYSVFTLTPSKLSFLRHSPLRKIAREMQFREGKFTSIEAELCRIMQADSQRLMCKFTRSC